MANNDLPVLAFTVGDLGGVGPEVVFRTLDYFSARYPFIPLLFGAMPILEHPFLSRFIRHKGIRVMSNYLPTSEIQGR